MSEEVTSAPQASQRNGKKYEDEVRAELIAEGVTIGKWQLKWPSGRTRKSDGIIHGHPIEIISFLNTGSLRDKIFSMLDLLDYNAEINNTKSILILRGNIAIYFQDDIRWFRMEGYKIRYPNVIVILPDQKVIDVLRTENIIDKKEVTCV